MPLWSEGLCATPISTVTNHLPHQRNGLSIHRAPHTASLYPRSWYSTERSIMGVLSALREEHLDDPDSMRSSQATSLCFRNTDTITMRGHGIKYKMGSMSLEMKSRFKPRFPSSTSLASYSRNCQVSQASCSSLGKALAPSRSKRSLSSYKSSSSCLAAVWTVSAMVA